MKAIFLDRDGTVIIDKNYLHKVADLEYFQDSFTAMKLLQTAGYKLFIVTNQSGVGRGYFPLEDVFTVHEAMQKHMQDNELEVFQDIQASPHHPDEKSEYRKPGPQMILDLIQKWNIIPAQSYMLGDKLSDAQAGENAGVQGVLVRKESLKEYDQYPFFKDLLSFAKTVI